MVTQTDTTKNLPLKIRWWRAVLSGLFFALFFLYVAFIMDPRLLYFGDGVVTSPSAGTIIDFPSFYLGTSFLGDFLARPGGLAEYAGAFLAQFCGFRFFGALVLTGLAFAVWAVTGAILKGLRATGGWHWRFVPTLLVLAAYSRYTFQLAPFVALLATLWVFVLYLHIARHPTGYAASFGLFTGGLVLLGYAACGTAFLFAVLCVLYELLVRRHYGLATAFLLTASGVSLIVGVAFDLAFADLVACQTGLGNPLSVFNDQGIISAVLFAFFILLVATAPLQQKIADHLATRYFIGDTVSAVALLALTAAVAATTLDRHARTVLRMNAFASRGEWEQVIREADQLTGEEITPHIYVLNRALFETGQIGDRMFAYPQGTDAPLPAGFSPAAYLTPQCVDTLLRLGSVNEAEHVAFEALEMRKDRPDTLRQLALIHIAKQCPQAARVFLGRLSKDLTRGAWARKRMQALDEDSMLNSDPEVARLCSLMPVDSVLFTGGVLDREALLNNLLRRNPANRMAFEYLMAYYLLTGQVDAIARNLSHLKRFGYSEIPESYSEALLLDFDSRPNALQPLLDLYGLRLSPLARPRLDEARRILDQHRNAPPTTIPALIDNLPDSYVRYVLTHMTVGTP